MKAAAATLLAVTLLACTGGASPRQSGVPTVKLLAQNLELFPGEQQAIRLGFQTASDSADIIADLKPDTAALAVCALPSIDATLPPAASCKDIGSGVRETITSSSLAAIALVVSGVSSARANIRLEYDDGGHAMIVEIPFLASPLGVGACKDNACNPFFEMTPLHNGTFTATANWSGPHGTLAMLQGSVLARSQSATGVPYREAARKDGSPPLMITTQVSTQSEYALIVTQQVSAAAAPQKNVVISATWP
jgi:hypothetical protein